MEENILAKEKIPKLFMFYSIPAIVSMLIVGTQSIIDGIFVGNFVGELAMASVNIAQPFTQILAASSMVIVIGSLSYMGRSLGENDIDKAQNIYRTSLILIVSIASFLTILGVFFSENLALLLGASDILIKDTSIYIKTISVFIIPMFLMYQFAFSNRLLEKPDLYIKGMILSLILIKDTSIYIKTISVFIIPMFLMYQFAFSNRLLEKPDLYIKGMILSLIANILLNILLVKYMSLGVFGTAVATALAEPLALFYVIGPHLNKNNVINIYVGKFDKKVTLPVVYNGLSEAFTSISTAITAYVFNKAFMKSGGEAGIAAFTIISYINLFTNYIMFGIADGIGPLVSYNYGAKSFKRVWEAMKFSYGISFLIGVIIFIILIFFGESLISVFISNNAEILNLAFTGAKIFAVGYLINGFNILNSAYFTSIGLAKESVIIALSRGCVVTLIGIFILPNIFGMNGIWMTVPFAEIVTVGVCLYLLKGYGGFNSIM